MKGFAGILLSYAFRCIGSVCNYIINAHWFGKNPYSDLFGK